MVTDPGPEPERTLRLLVDLLIGAASADEGAGVRSAKTAALRDEILVRFRPDVPSPDGDSLFIHVEAGAVNLTQTTGRTLRVAVNGVWAEAPDRERITVEFIPPGPGNLQQPVQARTGIGLPWWIHGCGEVHPSETRPEPDYCGKVDPDSWRPLFIGSDFAPGAATSESEFAPPREPCRWGKLDGQSPVLLDLVRLLLGVHHNEEIVPAVQHLLADQPESARVVLSLPYELDPSDYRDDGRTADKGISGEFLRVAGAADGWVEISVASGNAFVSPHRAREVIAAIKAALHDAPTGPSVLSLPQVPDKAVALDVDGDR